MGAGRPPPASDPTGPEAQTSGSLESLPQLGDLDPGPGCSCQADTQLARRGQVSQVRPGETPRAPCSSTPTNGSDLVPPPQTRHGALPRASRSRWGGAGWEEGRTGVGSRAGPPGRAGRVARLPGPAPTRLHVPRAGSGQRPGCSSHPGRTRCPPPRRPGEDTEARRGPATWQSVAVQSRRPGPQPVGPRASTALPTAEHGSVRGPHACERRPRSSSRVRRETEAQTGERPAAPDRKPEASVSCPPRAHPRGLSAPPSCRVPARPGSPRPRSHPAPH